MRIGRGASTYLGTMFDVGPHGRVSVGDFALVHGARIICDAEVEIGDYALISWNVVLMDSYRVPLDPCQRRRELERVPDAGRAALDADVAGTARPHRAQRLDRLRRLRAAGRDDRRGLGGRARDRWCSRTCRPTPSSPATRRG